jgi:hypothetical protein
MESLFDTSLKWPHEMLRYGAQILSDENTDEFIELLPLRWVNDDALAF